MADKLTRLFAQNPPTEPLTTLAAIIRDWRRRFGENGSEAWRRDGVIEFTKNSTSLDQAIDRATASLDARGKMYNHQSKIPKKVKDEFASRIDYSFSTNSLPITFDGLYDRLESLRPKGIGDVTTYDVAVRIGAYLGIKPTSLYLHAGVMLGWNALMFGLYGEEIPTYANRPLKLQKRIERQFWPKECQMWEADEFEDFLCCYRTQFRNIQPDQSR